MNRIMLLLVSLALASAVLSPVRAQTVPLGFNFQGRLSKPDGTPVADSASQSLTFRIYSAQTGGALLWSQTSTVTVRNGVFAKLLVFSTGFTSGQSISSVFNGIPLYLEIQVGTDAPLAPRQLLVSNAYAFTAMNALSVAAGSVGLSQLASGVLNFSNLSGQITGGQLGTGSVTNAAIASGTITADKFAANVFNPLVWLLGGNSGTNGTQFLGTTDNQPLVFKVNNHQATRYTFTQNTSSSSSSGYYRSINVLGGSEVNSIAAGVSGATIAGGGQNFYNATGQAPNTITADFGSISGGSSNTISAGYGTISGGANNTVSGGFGVVGGGQVNNVIGLFSVIVGGVSGTASGLNNFIGGGNANATDGQASSVVGGYNDKATANNASVGGGYTNTASGTAATIPGGAFNTAAGYTSFAAGQQAQANHDGAFVWNDASNTSNGSPFASTGNNQFLIHATGGVGIGTNAPDAPLTVVGKIHATGNVGINTNTPATPLDVNGTITDRGDFILNGRGGGLGNNSHAARALVDGGNNDPNLPGQSGLIINLFNDFGKVLIESDTYVSGKVYSNGVQLTSDARFKTNIQPFGNALDTILALRGVSYQWDKAKWAERGFADGRQIGFLAQEVEIVLPELVGTDANGYKSVNYLGVVPVLVEAVKTQHKQMNQLRRENEAMKQENAALKGRLDRLEAAMDKLMKSAH